MLIKFLSLGFILKKSFSLYFFGCLTLYGLEIQYIINILKIPITLGRYLKIKKNY